MTDNFSLSFPPLFEVGLVVGCVDMMEVAVEMVYEANEVRWWLWEGVFMLESVQVFRRDIFKKILTKPLPPCISAVSTD